MNITKSRKRLTAIILSFMLVFATGTAFAIGTGTLNVTGSVRLNNLDGEVRIVDANASGPLSSNVLSVSPDGQSVSWNVVIEPQALAPAGGSVLELEVANTSPVFGATVGIDLTNPGNVTTNFAGMGIYFNIPLNNIFISPMETIIFPIGVIWDSADMAPNFDLDEIVSFYFNLNWEVNP